MSARQYIDNDSFIQSVGDIHRDDLVWATGVSYSTLRRIFKKHNRHGFCNKRSKKTISAVEKEVFTSSRRQYMSTCSSIEYEILKSLDDLYQYYDDPTPKDVPTYAGALLEINQSNDDHEYIWLSQLEPVAVKDGFFIHEIKP